MRDFEGDMDIFQDQLTAAGISVEEFDITNYAGLTARELQGLVDYQIKRKGVKNGNTL